MNKYTVINPHEPFRVLNTHVHNVDGWAKITGRATYTFDVKLPGMLYGKILRSPHPHAKIRNIDASKALALDGVKAVVTGKDTLGVKQGIWRRYKDLCDEQILPVDKVRYIGEPVAAVAAVTEEIAEKALDLIEVDYEVLPAVFEPLDAIKKDAPEIHDGFERNISVTRHIEWGEVEEGFEESEYIREDWFRCGGQAHMCMETRCAVSSYTPDKKLTIYSSNQSPYYMQGLMAGVLGMREGDIRVLSPYVGGGFGGKFELDGAIFCSAILSMKRYKPVKIVYTREEDFIATKRRTPMFYYTRTGVKKDGTFCAREAKVFTNGGAYTGMGATALYLTGFFHSFPYRWKGYRYDGYRVYTNTLPSTSMRGFGAPQAMWCSEQQIEWIAADLGLDPIEMRRKNAHKEGTILPGQATIASCGIDQCYDEITKWIKSKGKLAGEQVDRHLRLRLHVGRYLQLVRHPLLLLIGGRHHQPGRHGRAARGRPGHRPGLQHDHGDHLRGDPGRQGRGHQGPLGRHRPLPSGPRRMGLQADPHVGQRRQDGVRKRKETAPRVRLCAVRAEHRLRPRHKGQVGARHRPSGKGRRLRRSWSGRRSAARTARRSSAGVTTRLTERA